MHDVLIIIILIEVFTINFFFSHLLYTCSKHCVFLCVLCDCRYSYFGLYRKSREIGAMIRRSARRDIVMATGESGERGRGCAVEATSERIENASIAGGRAGRGTGRTEKG